MQNEKWFTVNDTRDLQSGDIVETISKLPQHSPISPGMKIPFILHYGIVTCENGLQCFVHNVIGAGPTITPTQEIFEDRTIRRVYRTGMTDEQIIEKYNQYKEKNYSPVFFNCEHLINNFCGLPVKVSQVQAYAVALLILALLILILLLIKR